MQTAILPLEKVVILSANGKQATLAPHQYFCFAKGAK